MIMKFALVALVLCVGVRSQHPSENEFNLFCGILEETERMVTDVTDYANDENKDKEVLKEMEVLYNATTDNMNQFRKTLWETKDFFEEHPPPTDPENRRKAHREIGNLIDKGEKIIQNNREIAEKINQKMGAAKLPVAQGLYGENVTEIPKDEGNWTAVKDNTTNIFVDENTVANSCGNKGEKPAGKTLINDLFCVCVGGEADDAEGPCHPKIWPPKSWKGNGGQGNWKQIKYGSGTLTVIQSFNESFQKIEQVCREEMTENNVKSEKIPSLLEQYVNLIGKGNEGVKEGNKKIFGHSWRRKNKGHVETCDGKQGSSKGNGNNKNNEKICVDYKNNQNGDGKYDIPWHKKFKEASEKMDQTKDLEKKILKNRAALLLLKNQAWVAYSREKEDETSNLDDMNASDKKDTMAENKQGEPTNQEREYIDVPSQSTQGSQPSQPAPSNKDGRKYHYISSTEATQEEASAAPAGGGEPPYIYVSSTGTPSQQTPAPETPSQTQPDPPTQSAKRLRDENKTGE